MGWSPCVHFQIAVNVVAYTILDLSPRNALELEARNPYEPGDLGNCSLWHHRPTPVPPAAPKMPSRLGVMMDVQYSPSEAGPLTSIYLTL